MTSVTADQQELIDIAISCYLRTNDNSARQYLRLRQEALTITDTLQHELEEFGKATPETLLKLQSLKFENEKLHITYGTYLDDIQDNLKQSETGNPDYCAQILIQSKELADKQQLVKQRLNDLQFKHKPVVEKMKSLAEKFENALGVHKGRSSHDVRFMSSKNSACDENSTLLDFNSSVFSKDELELLFTDVRAKLAHLRTVDEISEEIESQTQSKEKEKESAISILKYLEETLQGGRAFQRLSDATYHYDASKSSHADIGGSDVVIDDYEKAIETLVREIQGLVARGTEAKERWLTNARKVEKMQSVLDKDMDIDT